MASARKVTRAAIFILCACENIFITVTMVVINNKIRVGQVFKLCLELLHFLLLVLIVDVKAFLGNGFQFFYLFSHSDGF